MNHFSVTKSASIDVKKAKTEFLSRSALARTAITLATILSVPGLAQAQTSITTSQNTTGSVQTYTVPPGFVRAEVTAKGGDGGTDTRGQAASGDGAIATLKFDVSPTDSFQSIVGQSGEDGTTNDGGAGGGAGTGVCFNSSLVLVGGGGGGADNTDNASGGAQNGGNDANNGRDGFSRTGGGAYASGGTPSNVADSGIPSGIDIAAGSGGGGINGAGVDYTAQNPLPNGIMPGTAFGGGAADVTCSSISIGGLGVPDSESSIGPGYKGGDGFGGGGGSWGRAAGGGGGYYGGGGAGNSGWAGGGGSFIDNTLPGFISGNLTAGANRQNNGNDGFVTIIVYGQPVAENDSVTGIFGDGTSDVLNVLADDVIASDVATTSNVTIAVALGSSVPSQLSFDTATGNISVNSGTPAGTYQFNYEICNTVESDICSMATAMVVVEAPPISVAADLSITKTNTPGVNADVDQADDTVISGSNTTYTLVVTNNGPDSVTGAVVTDAPMSGLSCTGTNAVTITGDGVPSGSFTIAELTGGGIALETLADGEATTLSFTCEVN